MHLRIDIFPFYVLFFLKRSLLLLTLTYKILVTVIIVVNDVREIAGTSIGAAHQAIGALVDFLVPRGSHTLHQIAVHLPHLFGTEA